MATIAAALDKVKAATFYIVMNSEGKFFRRKGYGGYGESWVDEPTTARIYVKLGTARGTVTFFSKNPAYPPPQILKISIGSIEVMDETKRLAKSAERKVKLAATRELREKKAALERAAQDLERAKQKLAQAGLSYKQEAKKHGK